MAAAVFTGGYFIRGGGGPGGGGGLWGNFVGVPKGTKGEGKYSKCPRPSYSRTPKSRLVWAQAIMHQLSQIQISEILQILC